MHIKKIYIKSFGAITDRLIEFAPGLNIIEGANESGKSTVAMFIKFVFYGLNAKAVNGEKLSERDHYINWENGIAAGYIELCHNGEDYRVERRIAVSDADGINGRYHEISKITKLSTGDTVKTVSTPGEYFFSFPEKVFVQSAFVKSIDRVNVDGAGLKVALENLLVSGDEEINTQKALERLDNARKELLHKNGNGGRIYDLTAEKKTLEETLISSQDNAKEIVAVEGSLADVSAKAKQREKEAYELGLICRAYEALKISNKVKDIEKYEEQIKTAREEIDGLSPVADSGLMEKLEACENNVINIENDIELLTEKKTELETKRDLHIGEDENGENRTVKKAKNLRNTGILCLTMGLTFFVLAIIGAVAFDVFKYSITSETVKSAMTWISLGSWVLGIAGLIAYIIIRNLLKKVYTSNEVESIEELEEKLKPVPKNGKYSEKLTDSLDTIDSVIEEAVNRHDREIDRGFEIGESVGITGYDNVFDVIDAAKKKVAAVCIRRDELTQSVNEIRGKIDILLEDVGENERAEAEDTEKAAFENVDREKIISMSKDEYIKICRAKEFAESAGAALRIKENDLEKKLIALRGAGTAPDEIAARISCLDGEIEKLTFRHKAIVCAYQALSKASADVRRDVTPKVAELATKIMYSATDGKYNVTVSGETLDVSFDVNGESKTVEYLSEGTKDLVYISVRCALVEVMYRDCLPPCIFDECFARTDADRLERILSVLDDNSELQSFVFTCRELEGKILPEANRIVL